MELLHYEQRHARASTPVAMEEIGIEAARQAAAAEADVAPAVIAVDAEAGLIVMERIDLSTHELLLGRRESPDANAQQQLAVVRALARLHRAGVPYRNWTPYSVFVPLESGGEAVMIDYEPHPPAPGIDSVWASLWWCWLEKPYRTRCYSSPPSCATTRSGLGSPRTSRARPVGALCRGHFVVARGPGDSDGLQPRVCAGGAHHPCQSWHGHGR